MTKVANSLQDYRSEYISRINKTPDYIDANIENPMTPGELASVANFSKYHFNRIFHCIVRETPFHFIQLVRIERAAMLMLAKRKMTICLQMHHFGSGGVIRQGEALEPLQDDPESSETHAELNRFMVT